MKGQAENCAPIRLDNIPSNDIFHRPVSTLDQNVWPDPADQLQGSIFCERYDSMDTAQCQQDFASFLEVQDGPSSTFEPPDRLIGV